MANITIHKNDATVTVDGYATFGQDVSALASNIWAINFDSSANTGHIEYTDATPNEDITSLTSDMQSLVDANNSAKASEESAIATEVGIRNLYVQAASSSTSTSSSITIAGTGLSS